MSYHDMQISSRDQLSVQPVSILRMQKQLHHISAQLTFSELYRETSQLLIMSGDMNFIHEHELINYIINVKHSTGSISSPSGQYGY